MLLDVSFYSNPKIDRKVGKLEMCMKYHLYIISRKHVVYLVGDGYKLKMHQQIRNITQPKKMVPSDISK